MATQWIEDTLAKILSIARGNPTDQATKDAVTALTARLDELTAKLRDNDANDAGQDETAAELKAAIDALIKQLAEAPVA